MQHPLDSQKKQRGKPESILISLAFFLKALYKVLDVAQLFQQGGADDLGERLIQLGIFVTCI